MEQGTKPSTMQGTKPSMEQGVHASRPKTVQTDLRFGATAKLDRQQAVSAVQEGECTIRNCGSSNNGTMRHQLRRNNGYPGVWGPGYI
jgi:hypothetical protein